MVHQEVTTVDITGKFMQADMEGDTVHVKLEGKMADLLTKLNPKLYRKYVTKKGRTVLYMDLKKHYTVRSELCFYSGKILHQYYRSGDLR